MEFIGISGGTCSGKTTLVRRLRERLGDQCASLSLDSYYHRLETPFEERSRLNHDLPEQFDWALLRRQVHELLAGHAVQAPVYDFPNCNRADGTQPVPPAPVLLLEGIHALLDADLRAAMSLRVFLESSRAERRRRRIERDLQERCPDLDYVIDKLEKQTEVAYGKYVEPTRVYADLVCAGIDEAERAILDFLRLRKISVTNVR